MAGTVGAQKGDSLFLQHDGTASMTAGPAWRRGQHDGGASADYGAKHRKSIMLCQ
jgi:hypothetical protein